MKKRRRSPKQNFVFMVVSNDEYEIPYVVGTRQEIADFLGIKPETVSSSMSRGSMCLDTRYKVIKENILLEDEI